MLYFKNKFVNKDCLVNFMKKMILDDNKIKSWKVKVGIEVKWFVQLVLVVVVWSDYWKYFFFF